MTSTTIAALNGLPAHCSGLPDGRTYAEEFRVYEVTGIVQLTRDEDDRDVHIALVDPGDANQTIVVEVADSACSGAVQSPYAATLTSARASYQSLGTLAGRTVRVQGVGFYDFDHGQTGRSRSCIELHPVVGIVLTSAPTPTPAKWWTLKKGQRRAICRMFTHVFGHELRLEVSRELVSSDVCRTDEEVLSCQERWRAGLEAKGWK